MADFHRAENAVERGEGICRTCCEPIWFELGKIGGIERTEPDWSDRVERGGDSLVCFKAVGYRHVPLEGREAAIYDKAYVRGAALAPRNKLDELSATVEEQELELEGLRDADSLQLKEIRRLKGALGSVRRWVRDLDRNRGHLNASVKATTAVRELDEILRKADQ